MSGESTRKVSDTGSSCCTYNHFTDLFIFKICTYVHTLRDSDEVKDCVRLTFFFHSKILASKCSAV